MRTLVAPRPTADEQRKVCRPCNGQGVLPTLHERRTQVGTPLTLLVRCPACEGHGVTVHPEDFDFLSV